MQCLQCQHENASNAKFCNQCAAPFAPVCGACGGENAADAKFCNQCATPLIAPISASDSVNAMQGEAESETRFHTTLSAVMWWLQRERRMTYRTLKYLLCIDDALLREIQKDLALRQLAVDDQEQVLVWRGETPPMPRSFVGDAPTHSAPTAIASSALPTPSPATETRLPSNGPIAPEEPIALDIEFDASTAAARTASEAERRQLTVMFCDLVGSTDLSGKLDPEDLREVVRAYQETAAEVINRYAGHIAQYLGDGLLIYFGFPVAHEDDAQRAVHTGLGIVDGMATLNTRLEAEYGVQLAVRIGIHTGPVVVGEMGGGGRHENLALGETPNIAARLEGLAQANTAVISPVTAQLVQRSFVLAELGPHELKGVAKPVMLYTVVSSREAGHDDYEHMLEGGFDALVGRDEEIGLMLRRWEQSKEGLGQVVLLCGEAGIGKSSLVEGLREHVRHEQFTRVSFRCSPYHINSALYPITENVQRALGWQPEDTPATQLAKLKQGLERTSLPLGEALPLMASLLSLPLPDGRYPTLSLTPQQQRQHTQDILVAWLLEAAERQPVLAVWEDLHWVDPSTLEILGLLVDQAPTANMLHVLTFRPEFEPTWPTRSHLTPITLNRLECPQVEVLVTRLAGDKALPMEVVDHIVVKTDGVPLYVEELTKMLLASDFLREEAEQYVLTRPLLTVAIPDTLQDSLMARLDQMNTAKDVAQLGSVLGREFSYDLLQAISWQDDETFQSGLAQLVQAELLYQRGRPPRATYIFKHALIQDAAYASLLRSTRQRVHQQIAQLFEARFPETVETQPELLAYHYTEAEHHDLAVAYWQRAGHRANTRSAHLEAASHLNNGLQVLTLLPETPERVNREIALQVALGQALMAAKGQGVPEVERAFSQAFVLCQQVEESPQLFSVLWGLWRFYLVGAKLRTALELGEQCLSLAQTVQDPSLLIPSHLALGGSFFMMGDFASARTHLEQGISLYDPQQHRELVFSFGIDLKVWCLSYLAWSLWVLGYPEQALRRSHEALALAQELAHPFSLTGALDYAAWLSQFRREAPVAQKHAETAIALAREHEFPQYEALGMSLWGWALANQGQGDEGIAALRQSTADHLAAGTDINRPYCLAMLADVGKNEPETGIAGLSEALTFVDNTDERWWESELYRLQGTLLLHQTIEDPQQAETCFQQALHVAKGQQAKSLELRAATSLARLWQSQDKYQDAYDLLAPVYGWFTEGFETADLVDAKVLLDELGTENIPSTS